MGREESNQILYYISLFSKIRCNLTYLPKNLTSYVNAPQVEKSGKFTRKVIYPSTDIFTSCLKSNCGAYFLVVTVTYSTYLHRNLTLQMITVLPTAMYELSLHHARRYVALLH